MKIKRNDILCYKLSVYDFSSDKWQDWSTTYMSFDAACKDAESIRNTEHKAVYVMKCYVDEALCRFYPAETSTYEESGISYSI